MKILTLHGDRGHIYKVPSNRVSLVEVYDSYTSNYKSTVHVDGHEHPIHVIESLREIEAMLEDTPNED